MNAARDDEKTAFPASPDTPGQAESRTAYQSLQDVRDKCSWWDEYLELREDGWTWRKAAFIAWSSLPGDKRWPQSQQELATQVLGLKSDRTLRKWRRKDPRIDEAIAQRQATE